MVQIFIALTDRRWFEALGRAPPDEVNIWQPSGRNQFRALRPGELFLFKLHAPLNVIVGGGVFSHASNVPLSIAWDAFGTKNGAASLPEMRQRIAKYRRDPDILDPRADPVVGCRILTEPFFWPDDLWLPVPASFSRNIVQGKGYGTDTNEGRMLWDAVAARLSAAAVRAAPAQVSDPTVATGGAAAPFVPGALSAPRFGAPTLVPPRLGQGAFRLAVTDGYERRCAVTGEKTLPILDAAHIRAFSAGGEHEMANGLLLRTDIHRLFDLGYVTVSEKSRFEVSGRLKADFDNGKHYYDLHGAPVRAPRRGLPAPSAEALAWHREHRYLG